MVGGAEAIIQPDWTAALKIHPTRLHNVDGCKTKMAPMWTTEYIRRLIQHIKENRYFWDMKDVNFKNKQLKEELVKKFRKEAPFTEEEIRRKWRNLRTQFFRELRKTKNWSATAPNPDTVKSNWCFFDDLLFMKDCDYPKETPTTMPVPDSSLDGSLDGTEDNNTLEQERPFKKKKPDTDQNILLKKATFALSTIRNRIHEKDLGDEFTAFGQHVAEDLRKEENPQVVAYAKFKISEILYQRATGLLIPPHLSAFQNLMSNNAQNK